jgi:GGDEF domain-containing protein
MSSSPAFEHEAERTILALLEIVRFEALKRTVGYAAATNLLLVLAERVNALNVCQTARGDRYYVEATLSCPPGTDPRGLLDAMAREISGPIDIDGYEFLLGVRIGAAIAEHGENADTLFGRAERSLAQANEQRKSITIAQPEAGSAFASRLMLMRGLQEPERQPPSKHWSVGTIRPRA